MMTLFSREPTFKLFKFLLLCTKEWIPHCIMALFCSFNVIGENMGDVVGQQQEERIDALVMEKSQLENEIQIEKEVRERTQFELQKEKAHKFQL